MRKDELRYVAHMIDAGRRIEQFVTGKDRAAYDADEILRLAVAHLIQTIGEAARLVPASFQQEHAHIPWPQIIAMRNRIVHDYVNIDYDIVWQVASHDVPALVAALDPLVPPNA